MRVVDRPVTRPNRCVVLPYVGQTHAGTRWVDAGVDIDGFDNHVYVSEIAVREMAALFGMVNPGVVKAQELAIGERDARIVELEARVAEQARELDAIDVLESANFRSRRKPGRPAKQAEEAVV